MFFTAHARNGYISISGLKSDVIMYVCMYESIYDKLLLQPI